MKPEFFTRRRHKAPCLCNAGDAAPPGREQKLLKYRRGTAAKSSILPVFRAVWAACVSVTVFFLWCLPIDASTTNDILWVSNGTAGCNVTEPFAYNNDCRIFKEELENAGYTIYIPTSNIDLLNKRGELDSYEIIVYAGVIYGFANRDLPALKSFVEQGGSLLIPYDCHLGGCSNSRSAAEIFGVHYDGGAYYGILDPKHSKSYRCHCLTPPNEAGRCPMVESEGIAAHSITKGVTEVHLACAPYILDLGASTPLVTTSQDAWIPKSAVHPEERHGPFHIVSYLEHQSGGRIVFVADASIFGNTAIMRGDNLQLGLNIIDWLAQNGRSPSETTPVEGEIKFLGTAVREEFGPGVVCWWVVSVDKHISGAQPCAKEIQVIVGGGVLEPGYVDSSIEEGDRVEVYGLQKHDVTESGTEWCFVHLPQSYHYIKRISGTEECRLRVQVYDLVTGRMISGAAVYVDQDQIPRGLTDSKGEITFSIPKGPHTVRASSYGYEEGSWSGNIDRDMGIAIGLNPNVVHYRLQVQVYDATSGRMLPEASVYVDQEPFPRGMTDADGETTISVSKGVHTIRASMPGYDEGAWNGQIDKDMGIAISLDPSEACQSTVIRGKVIGDPDYDARSFDVNIEEVVRNPTGGDNVTLGNTITVYTDSEKLYELQQGDRVEVSATWDTHLYCLPNEHTCHYIKKLSGPVSCADTVVKGEIISEPVYSPRHFDLRIDEVIKNRNNIPTIAPGQNIIVTFSSALDPTVGSLHTGNCVKVSGVWGEDASQYIPGLRCDPDSCGEHFIEKIACPSVAEIKFVGTITEPDNKMLDDAFDCKVKIEEILENPSGIAINEGDEVIVHKWIWCGQHEGGLTEEPGGAIIPEEWIPAKGDKVEVYGRLSDEYTSIPGHSEASYLLNLCGSDQYYLKRLTPPTRRALIIAPFYTVDNTPSGKRKPVEGYSKKLAERLVEAGWDVTHLGDNEEVKKAEVLQELRKPYDLIHITTHGGYEGFTVDPPKPSDENPDMISPQDIEPFPDGSHPLVYLAYCLSNKPPSERPDLEDGLMSLAFVEKGASACVGFTNYIYFCEYLPTCRCRWQGERSAYDVAGDFYDQLAAGLTVEQAVEDNCACSYNCPCNGNYDSCLKHTGLASVTLDIPSTTGGADSWIGRTASVLGIRAFCPVDLSVVDPEGLVISKSTNAILEATYTEADLNGDGDPDDQIIIPNRKAGDYQIRVIPEERSFPIDRYTLEVSDGFDTIVLADYVRVGDIPEEPYVVTSTAEGIAIAAESEAEPDVPSPTPAPTPSPKQGINLSMLIAIIAGAVALVAIGVGVFLFLRSRYYI